MPIAIREQLMAAITTAVDGEYGVPGPEIERSLPVTIVQDGEDVGLDDNYGLTYFETPLVVGKAAEAENYADGNAMRAQAHDLLAALITTMFTDETFGSLADGITYTGGSIAAEVGKFVFAEASFTVRWHHVRGDPYTIDET